MCNRTRIFTYLIWKHLIWNIINMMTSSNGNISRVTGHLCEEFTCHRWIPLTKASDAELWCFLSTAWINGWVNNREAGDLIRRRAHYEVTLMTRYVIRMWPFEKPALDLEVYSGGVAVCVAPTKLAGVALLDAHPVHIECYNDNWQRKHDGLYHCLIYSYQKAPCFNILKWITKIPQASQLKYLHMLGNCQLVILRLWVTY